MNSWQIALQLFNKCKSARMFSRCAFCNEPFIPKRINNCYCSGICKSRAKDAKLKFDRQHAANAEVSCERSESAGLPG